MLEFFFSTWGIITLFVAVIAGLVGLFTGFTELRPPRLARVLGCGALYASLGALGGAIFSFTISVILTLIVMAGRLLDALIVFLNAGAA